MRDNNKNFFNHLDPHEPPRDLLRRIMARVATRQLHYARIRLVSFTALFLTGICGIVPAIQELRFEMTQSGFSQFVSLFLSDTGTLLAHWQDFLATLAETLPVFGLLVTLGSLFALLFSLQFLLRDMHVFFHKGSRFVGA